MPCEWLRMPDGRVAHIRTSGVAEEALQVLQREVERDEVVRLPSRQWPDL